MNNPESLSGWSYFKSTQLYSMCSNAFTLMKQGKETEARSQFPLEYYLLKKYLHLDLEQFAKLLDQKLELH
jgi:hypothetical protein